jgi:hypothetical protein
MRGRSLRILKTQKKSASVSRGSSQMSSILATTTTECQLTNNTLDKISISTPNNLTTLTKPFSKDQSLLPQDDKDDSNDGFVFVKSKKTNNLKNKTPLKSSPEYETALEAFFNKCRLVKNDETSEPIDGDNFAPPPPLVIISRGIPGCGKSYLAHRIQTAAASAGRTCVICSADKYFELNSSGKYIFDFTKLGNAHSYCKSTFEDALSLSSPVIIVDNTNTTIWEYGSYIETAQALGADVQIVELALPIQSYREQRLTAAAMQGKKFSSGKVSLSPKSRDFLMACGARNAHSVPLDSIEKMFMRWEEDNRSFKIPVGGFDD